MEWLLEKKKQLPIRKNETTWKIEKVKKWKKFRIENSYPNKNLTNRKFELNRNEFNVKNSKKRKIVKVRKGSF